MTKAMLLLYPDTPLDNGYSSASQATRVASQLDLSTIQGSIASVVRQLVGLMINTTIQSQPIIKGRYDRNIIQYLHLHCIYIGW